MWKFDTASGRRGPRTLLLSLLVLGVLLVGGTLAGALLWTGGSAPRVEARAATPPRPRPVLPPPVVASPVIAAPVVRQEPEPVHRAGKSYYRRVARKKVTATEGASFVPIYREAERTFGVAWQLVAAVHRQETAFSTVEGTYAGLNAFGCCAGPMQFNVTNGPGTTWDLYKASFKRGERPQRYPHRTSFHPSVYDDFDAIMAAGALLRDGGASRRLDGGSWLAAYAYYGHDTFGVSYASQVLGRAQTWAKAGFCPNCADDAKLVAALDDAYGVDARLALLSAAERARLDKAKGARAKRKARAKKRRAAAAAAKKQAATAKKQQAAAKEKKPVPAEKGPAARKKKPAAQAPATPEPAAKTPAPAPPSGPTATETTPTEAAPAPPTGATCTNLLGMGC